MSDPSPSSVPSVRNPPLFHHSDGQRISVFVEAGGILNRPRLIRNLKKHDAAICSDPKYAQVILVDAESWQGKEFIREWGMDQNKVVLNHQWVTNSISAGRPLLADDNWGGNKTRDDGLPILRPNANGDVDTLAPNPLLTPYETPLEVNATLPKGRVHSKRLSKDDSLPRISTTPSSPELPSSSTPHLPLYPPNLSQQTQQQQQSQPLSPTMSDMMSTFAQQQQAPPAMPFGMSNGVMPGFNMPLNMLPFTPQMLSMFAQQQQSTPPLGTQPSTLMPQIQDNFTTALVDVLKMYGAMPGGAPGGLPMSHWPILPNIPAQMQQQMTPSAEGSSGSGTVVQEGSSTASSGMKTTGLPDLSMPVSASLSPIILSPSIKRKRGSDAIDFNSDEGSPATDGEEDEPPLPTLHKNQKSTDKQVARRKEKDQRKAKRTSLQYTVPQRNPHGQSSTPNCSGDPSKKLLVHSDGKPMQFFVQVDQNNRQEVTRAIKKNGGSITSQIAGADYAVLYTLSTTFKSLLMNATTSGTPAVTHHFVLDAISRNSVPKDLSDYLFDAKQKLPKRPRTFSSPAEAEQKRLEKNAKQAERAKQQKEMKYNYVARSTTPEFQTTSTSVVTSASPSATKKQKPMARTASSQTLKGKEKAKENKLTTTPPSVRKGRPSVGTTTSGATSSPVVFATVKKPKPGYYPREKTPSPPKNPEKHTLGYQYTQEERDWAEKYLFILFKRDPNISQTAIAKALHRYLPHHSFRSWGAFLNGLFKEQYEEARKRGGISHRKEKSRWEAEQEKLWSLGDQGQRKVKEKEKSERGQTGEEEIEDLVMGDLETIETAAEQQREEPQASASMMQTDESPQAPLEVAGNPGQVVEGKGTLTTDEVVDINTIVQFFLDGGDPGGEEDLVWEKLEQQASCKSMSRWVDFFTRHDATIVDKYHTLLEQQKTNE